MNVTELARQLKTTRDELLTKLPALGFDIGQKAIKIDNLVATRIKEAWFQDLRKQNIVTKMQDRQVAGAPGQAEAGAKEVPVPARITVNDLAALLGKGVPHVIGYLMRNGVMASLNQPVDFETASIVAADFGFKAVPATPVKDDTGATEQALRTLKQDIAADKDAVMRPPVVVVMGHVDHGKTTLLDAIRATNVVAGESGGITQHIGAYQVEVPPAEEPKSRGDSRGIPRRITFLDTPGHEAFKAMRERGGQVADVAILVVAADDGLKPQTLESINVIQKESLPFVVAINKMDKPGADIDKVKKELAEINLVPEDWGGKTICVSVSAKQKLNIAELLDMVLLVADLEKFSANPNGPATGVIIESHIDRGEGPVATVLVNAGTLRVGDEVVFGATYGRVKALKDWRGQNVSEAKPAMPVKILGLKNAPQVGDILRVGAIERSTRKQKAKDYRFGETAHKPGEDKISKDNETKEVKTVFNIIAKADVLGSLEAVLEAVKKLEREDVGVVAIKQGLGNITEADIALAETTGATVYGFNVQLTPEARKSSYRSKAGIKIYKIIYELLDDVEAQVKALIKTVIVEIPQGEVKVLKVFKDSRQQSIIGGRVGRAKITAGAKFRLMREGAPVDEGKIVELQQNKQPVEEVKEGVECGLKVSGARGFKESDVLACYSEEERRV